MCAHDAQYLISKLQKSKNLLRFQNYYFEMQCFDPMGKEYFIKIDYQDLDIVSKFRWKVDLKAGSYVSITGTINKKTVCQSRMILNPKMEMFVDHINGDPTDNRRSNLREVTHQQNMQNRKSLVNRKWKGIHLCKQRNLWVAQIHVDGKTKNIGRFLTDKQAAIAYNEAAKKHHGDYARLNEFDND